MKKGWMFFLPCMLALTLALTSFVRSPARASATSPILGHVYTIVNRSTRNVIEVYMGSTDNHALIGLEQKKNPVPNYQLWTFESTGQPSNSGPIYQIVNANIGSVLDIVQSHTQPGIPVEQYVSNGGSNQQWQVSDHGDGYALIENVNSQLYLTGNSSSKLQGDIWVYQEPLLGQNKQPTPDQEWQLICAGILPGPGGSTHLTDKGLGSTQLLPCDSTSDSPTFVVA